MMGRMRALAAVVTAMVSGCASITAVQTADTIGRGNLQWGIETGIQGTSPRDGDTGFAWPRIDVAARYGLTERLDVGARIGQSVLEVNSKFLFTSPEDPHVALSLLPSAGGLVMIDSKTDERFGTFSFALPVLFGIKLGPNELVVAPRAQYLVFLVSKPVHAVLAGGSVGFAIRVSPNFIVMPELGFTLPVLPRVPPEMARFVRAYANGPLFQFTVGLLLGHTRTSHPEGNPHQR